MADYICTEKIYDAKSRLVGYKIKNEHGQEKSIDTGTLKNAIRTGQIHVRNLELTDSNRLKFIPYTYILRKYKNGNCEEIELRPGAEVWLDDEDDGLNILYRYSIVISTLDEQKELKLNNLIDLYDERQFQGRKFKKFEKKKRTQDDLGYYANCWYTPYTCKMWIDNNIYIKADILYSGPFAYKLNFIRIVYKSNE